MHCLRKSRQGKDNFCQSLLILTMPLVQLSKLRPQLNALEVHFKDPEMFQESLISLFQMYENKRSSTNIWLRKSAQFASYNVPDSVMSELESRIAVLSRKMPDAAIVNADTLWKHSFYELKKTAIVMISNLDNQNENHFFQKVKSWMTVDLEDVLTKELLASIESKPELSQSKKWLDIIKSWLDSNETQTIKLGLQALKRTLIHAYQNLPAIFSILTPLLHNPQLAIQKELTGVIQSLVQLSEAETASFLIMTGELFPDEDVLKYVRKCLPLFDKYFQDEIRRILFTN